jgi:serine/threonine protein phosphatase 1
MGPVSTAPGHLPEGRRIYAIGDIHGCLDRLVAMHWRIAADLVARPVRESVLIHIGDYIDRGPDSAGVVWLLAGQVAPPVTRRVDLMGNHELMLLDTLVSGSREAADIWMHNGGQATMASYGMPPGEAPAHLGLLIQEWRRAVPQAHLDWIGRLDLTHQEGDYLFVHAGIRPGRPLKQQTRNDVLWIREPFLSDRTPRDVVVVHGHTPAQEPEVFANRIGIDTGAVLGGKLTCVVLEQDHMHFLAT